MQNFRLSFAAFDLICINSHKITTSLLVLFERTSKLLSLADDVHFLFPVIASSPRWHGFCVEICDAAVLRCPKSCRAFFEAKCYRLYYLLWLTLIHVYHQVCGVPVVSIP